MQADTSAVGHTTPRDTPLRALLVTLGVCGLCSALVTSAVLTLRPYQAAHRERDRAERIVAMVAALPGLEQAGSPVGGVTLEARVVELASGRFAAELDPGEVDVRQAEPDPAFSEPLPRERDPAGIGRRPHHVTVYLVRRSGVLRLLVLPVYGAGYASTLHGYLALDADGNTVRALEFYEHGETPGLGSEIENPDWRSLWAGKLVRDETGAIRIGVARGQSDRTAPEARFEVDGISGATRTGQGVTRLLRFWLGPDGYGPFLERMTRGGGQHDG